MDLLTLVPAAAMLLAQAAATAPRETWLDKLVEEPDFLKVATVMGLFTFVILSVTSIKIARMVIRHRERLALIEHGMDPDRPVAPAPRADDPR